MLANVSHFPFQTHGKTWYLGEGNIIICNTIAIRLSVNGLPKNTEELNNATTTLSET